MDKDEKYKRAKERVKELKDFYTHLLVYLAIMTILFFVDYSDSGNWWFHWPAIFWGAFVLIQAISVSKLGAGWEDKKIKQIMEKDQQ